MKPAFDVLIVGGGMVGAALACALGNSRLKIGVLDSRAPVSSNADGYDLRVSAITLATRSLFQNLGVWEGMERRRVAPVEAMQVWEAEREIRFDAAEIGEACLAYIVENSVIQQALVERLQSFTNVHCLWPVEIQTIAVTEDAASITLKDGRMLQACVLVGADGADSAVRRAVGIESRLHDVQQMGIVATVRTQQPHAGTARQRFLTTGPLAFLPLPEANTSSIVWSVDTARAEALMALADAAFAAQLQTAFGDSLGAITSVSRRQAFVLTLAHAQAYTAPRAVLIGDAAHTVHPLAGQGVNLGLMDAAALAELLLDADAQHRDLGTHALLRRYERARKGENLGMIAVTGGLKYFFGSASSWARRLRGIGLGFANAATPLKRAMMRRASGLEGDVPALARRHTTE